MAAKKKVTPKNLVKVLTNLQEFFLEHNNTELKEFCKSFNDFLDELADDDFFGTEKQCDPRGDQRS